MRWGIAHSAHWGVVVLVRPVLAMLLAAFAAGCAMVSSTIIEEGTAGRCTSDAGFYYLPKTHLLVEVVAGKKGTGDASAHIPADKWHEISVKRIRLPDKDHGYCLDYLAQASSDDIVTVRKYRAAPLLGLVSSDAKDRSLEVAETVVRTIFTAVSGNPDYKLTPSGRSFYDPSTRAVTVFRADYDPFDPARSSGINEALAEFGFCLVLETYTFNLSAASIDSYCDRPVETLRRSKHQRLTYQHGRMKPRRSRHNGDDAPAPSLTDAVSGLFYRPRMPYQLYVFVKDNMQARGGWALRSTHPVALENIAPILSIGVDRTMFAQRRTTLVFDEGMLKEACHYKGSELIEFVKLPLVVVQSVVALPANILSVRVDQTSGLKELIAAQNNAIETQTRYLAELNNLPDKARFNARDAGPAAKVARPIGSYRPDETASRTDADIDTFSGGRWNQVCKTAVDAITKEEFLKAKTLSQGVVQ